MTEETNTFAANYKVLQEIAEKFRKQTGSNNAVPDIDNMVSDVERAATAYKACKERLETIKNAVEGQLPQESGDAS